MNIRYLAAAVAILIAAPAAAQTFPVKMAGQHSAHFKGRGRIAVPSYSINYVIAQRASASASVGAKARSTTILAGIDEATMRGLADEAFADLKRQMQAAGLQLASDEEAAGVLRAAGAEMMPGNMDSGRDGGIVIGKGIKKQYVAFGASAAPLTTLYQTGGKVGGFAALGKIGAVGKLNRPGEAIDSVLLFPSLTVDFAESEVKIGRTLTGDKRASATNEVRFSIRAESPVNLQNPAGKGLGTPGMFRPAKDYSTDAQFALVEGAAGASSREHWNSLFDDGMVQNSSRVVADPAKWSGLVRAAYRDYNAAIVAAILQVRK